MEKDQNLIRNKLNTSFKNVFDKKLIDEIAEVGTYTFFKKGDMLIDIGDEMTHIPLLMNGLIKVLREDNKGNELLLYFLEQKDTCAISFINCINKSKSMFRALVEEDAECILIPVNKIEDWITKYKSWRVYIIDSYHSRLIEMVDAINGLAFLNLDNRLDKYLTNQVKIKKSNNLSITHQEIANDLHTSRVVISRLLKTLENDGKIKLGRNKIHMSIS